MKKKVQKVEQFDKKKIIVSCQVNLHKLETAVEIEILDTREDVLFGDVLVDSGKKTGETYLSGN